jgi:hypothetical protein
MVPALIWLHLALAALFGLFLPGPLAEAIATAAGVLR